MAFPAGPDHVDAAWLAEVLAAAGERGGPDLREVRAVRIGEGYGLDGTLARITLTDAAGAETTIVGKWCARASGEREARFYREVAPLLPLALCRLRAAAFDGDRALLLLEDLAPARQGDAIVGATPNEAERLIDGVAAVHARFWDAAGDPAVAWLPRWGSRASEMIERTRASLPRFFARYGATLSPVAVRHAERLPESLRAAHAVLADAPPTLVHNDLHLDNVLFRPDGTPVVIDWPDAALGPGVVDVARVLLEGLNFPTRRALEAALLDRYLRGLAAHGVRCAPSLLDAHLTAAVTVLFAGAVRFKEPGPGAPARLVPIIDNLVANVAAAVEDRTPKIP
jgi:hypothetical protein